jgi:hypothetical protein
MEMENAGKNFDMAFKAATGELYMLGKKERILLRALLDVTLRSVGGREIIAEKCGKESLHMAKTLLREMGGDLDGL